MNKGKPENSFNIAKNQEFELITSYHFKNLISPKPTWKSHWSLISYYKFLSDSITAHTCPYFGSFFLQKKKIFRKIQYTWTWESNSNYFNCSSWTFKVELQLWWYKNLFSSSFKGLPTKNFRHTSWILPFKQKKTTTCS